MKNQEEKFDLLFKEEIGNYELAPPPELKEKVFIEMQASGFFSKNGRNILIILSLLFISLMAVITLLFFNANKTIAYGKPADATAFITEPAKSENKIISESQKNASYKLLKSNKLNENHYKNKPANEKKSSKNEAKPYNTNNSLIVTTDPNLQTSQEVNIKNKSEINITESSSLQEKSKNVNSPALAETFLPHRMINISSDAFSLFNKGINENLVRNIKTKQPLILSIGFYAGHSLVQGPVLNISKTNNEDENNYTSMMQWTSGSIGMNVKIEKKHFFGEIGLQVSKFTEQINTDKILTNPSVFQNIDITQNSLIDTTGGYYHYYYVSDSNVRVIDSVWTWKVDTSLYNVYDTVNKTTYDTITNPSWKNSYSFIDLPLSFGWQKNFGRFNFGIKTGPIINLLITTKGSIPIKYNNTIILTDIKDEFKKYQFGLSWQAAATLGYFISSNFAVECSPYYRFTLIGIKPINTGAEIKNNSFGLQLGLRYYF